MLHNSPQAVAMRRNNARLSRFHCWHDVVLPEWQSSLYGQLQTLVVGDVCFRHVLVSGVPVNRVEVWVVFLHLWWRNVEATAPNVNLGKNYKNS